MKLFNILYFLIAIFVFNEVNAQKGGKTSFSVLDLRTSARIAGLSTDFLAIKDQDISLALANPSLIEEGLHNKISFSFINQFSGINYGSASYAYSFKDIGTFCTSLQYINTGSFDRYSEEEEIQGKTKATDLFLAIGWGRSLDSNFFIGANLKPILSSYDSYRSFALAVDVSASYVSNDQLFCVSVLAKNIGSQLTTYSGIIEPLPFNLSFGLSKKLAKAPFRLIFNFTNIQQWNLRFEDPLFPSEKKDFEENTIKASKSSVFFDNFFRHTQFGIEICPSKSFYLRFGYNYRQAKENRVTESLNFAGFGFGFGVRIKKIEIHYARNNHHLGQAPNYITISTNLSSFKKTKIQ